MRPPVPGQGCGVRRPVPGGVRGACKSGGELRHGPGGEIFHLRRAVILGEVRRLFRDGGALRVSRGMRDLGRKAQETADQLRQETGKAPGVAQVAQHLGVPVEKAALALGVGQAPLSLTGPEDGGEVDVPVEAPEERMTERLTLYQILQTLEERDRKLIQYRYFQGKTQTQTAALLGMTQVQVSRREKKLLLFMRAAFDQ